jgi:hypothetical protein
VSAYVRSFRLADWVPEARYRSDGTCHAARQISKNHTGERRSPTPILTSTPSTCSAGSSAFDHRSQPRPGPPTRRGRDAAAIDRSRHGALDGDAAGPIARYPVRRQHQASPNERRTLRQMTRFRRRSPSAMPSLLSDGNYGPKRLARCPVHVAASRTPATECSSASSNPLVPCTRCRKPAK